MNAKEIKAVFDRTFNGMPNPIFCHPYSYFEHNGYLCEAANSPSSSEMAEVTRRGLPKSPFAIFNMMLGDCGAWLTVLTMDGKRTDFDGHFESEEELTELLNQF